MKRHFCFTTFADFLRLSVFLLVCLAFESNAQSTSGLVANYSFNNGNGTDDANGNNATVVGATLTTGHEGNSNTAYTFAAGAYMNCGNAGIINSLTKAYTLSAWFKRSATPSQLEVIVGKWSGSASSDHFLLGVQNDKFVFATAGPGKNGVASTSSYALNTWNHVVFTWESTGVHKLYLNGTLIGTTNLAAYTVLVNPTTNLFIGAQSSTVRRFNGDIDDVKIYDRVLLPEEVSILYGHTMNKQEQVLTFTEIPDKITSDPSFDLTASSNVSLPPTFVSSHPAILSVSGNTGTAVGGGTARVSALQTGDATYNGAFLSQSVKVTALQTITFDALADKVVGDPTFNLTATASSSLPITYTSSNTSVATIAGNIVTILNAGTTTITASQAGNVDYLAAPSVEQVLTVSKADQTITFNSILDKELIEGSFLLGATSNRQLPITYSSSNPEIASVAGNTVTLNKIGSVTITASQAGNANYNSAISVDQSFDITIGNGLVAHYSFSGTANDAVFGNNGTVTNATLVPDRFTNPTAAYSFNGAANINYGATQVMNELNKAYTLSAWFKKTSTQSDYEVILAKWANTAVSEHFFLSVRNDKIVFATAGAGKNGVASTASFTLNAWNHVVLTYDFNGTHKLYLNNVLVVSTILAPHTLNVTAPVNLMVGAQSAGFRAFNGQIDDVRIYKRVLSSSEVSLLYTDDPTKQNQTINFEPIGEKKFGSGDFSLEATSTSSLPVSYVSSNTSVISVDGSTATITGVGSAVITAVQEGDAAYNGNTSVQPVTVSKNDQTIDLSGFATVALAESTITLPATTNAGLEVSYSSSNTSVATVAGNIITLVAFGETTITASQAGNSFYNPMSTQQLITVERADQEIVFNTLAARNYGDAPIELPETSSGGLAISYTSSNTQVATVQGNLLTIVGVGTTSVTASQPGNSLYNPALSVEQLLVVEKGDQAIEFNPFELVKYGILPIELTSTSTGGLTIEYVSSNTEVATINGSVVTIVGIGTATITAAQSGDDFYNPAQPVEQHLTVEQGDNEITFPAFGLVRYGDDNLELEELSSAGLTITYTSSNTDVATVSGSTILLLAPGTTTITANQPGNVFFVGANQAQQVLEVSKALQTLTFVAPAAKTFGNAAFDLEASSDANLEVTFTSSDASVATVSGYTVTIVGAGTAILTANQAGNQFYESAQPIEHELQVAKANQIITFLEVSDVLVNAENFQLTAESTSILPISFSSSNTGVATVSGSIVSVVGAGSVTITASQTGNQNYTEAIPVERSFTVSKLTQSITFNSIETRTVGDASFSLTASATSTLGVDFSTTSNHVSFTGSQVTINSAGSVTIEANQSGDATYSAAAPVTQTFCINPAKPAITGNFIDSTAPILTSSEAQGNQWFRNGTTLPTATSQTFVPTEPGVYTVRATVDGCTSLLSDEFTLLITGSETSMKERSLSIYPNPATDRVVIQLPKAIGVKLVMIYQADGKVVYTKSTSQEEVEVNTQNFVAGISYIMVTTEDGKNFAGKLIKKL